MPRSFHRKMVILGGLSFDSWYAQNFGAIGWTLQEPSGDVALAINKRVDLGRELVINGVAPIVFAGDDPVDWDVTEVGDATSNVTENPAGEIQIISDGTAANITQDILEVGKPYTISGTITAVGSGALKIVVGLNQIGTVNSTGPFSFSGTATTLTKLQVSRVAACNITVGSISAKQTDIAASSEFPGAEEITNGDFSAWTADDPDNWTVTEVGDVTSNVTENPSGSIQMISDTTLVSANQTVFTIGKRYRLIISISSITGSMQIGPTTGPLTTITTPGDKVLEFISTATTLTIKRTPGQSLNVIIPNVSVTEANPINATNNGMAVAQPGQGNIPLVYSGDGGTTRLSFDTIAEINSIINMSNGGFVMVAQSDTWAAGVDELVHFGVGANDYWRIYRSAATLNAEYVEDGNSSLATLDTTTLPGGSPTGLYTIGLKYDVDGFGLRLLYKGVQFDTDKAIAAAIIGNLDVDECALFAADSSGTSSWAGDGAYPALQTETPDDSFFAEFHNRSGL